MYKTERMTAFAAVLVKLGHERSVVLLKKIITLVKVLHVHMIRKLKLVMCVFHVSKIKLTSPTVRKEVGLEMFS